VALASPLTDDFEIDVDGASRLVEHVISGGIHGINVLGSTGEIASLSAAKRRTLIDAVMDATGGRVPVITAMAQDSLEEASRELEALARQGVRGVLVTPPHYYTTVPAAIEDFYRSLAETSPLPLLIYNIPQFTKISVAPRTVASLARDGAIVGIKDSSRDFEYFTQLMYSTRGIDGFRVFTGSDTMLLASLTLGADGTIAGGPNLEPSFAVELFEAFHAGDFERARDRQRAVVDMVFATRVGTFPAGIKAGLELMGICGSATAPPIPRLADADRQQLATVMAKLGIIPRSDVTPIRRAA
jgi:4-hydroxy-tetrahydrodipicolinate synthase